MLTELTVTQQQSFQVLDPSFPPPTPPGALPEQYAEDGLTNIPIGTQTMFVGFLTQKAANEYIFDELEIQNTIDPSLLVLAPVIGFHNNLGFNVSFTGVPDTINYYLRWAIRVVPT